jgi:DNA-binding transcriptional LysR family regulator
MDLNEMVVFARVVQAGSFTAAAASLGMPKSTVSRKVTELEERLKSRLIQRTTRKLSLTDVGRTYYEYCARIAGEVEDAEQAVNNLQATPRGHLRITAGTNAQYLGPIVADFLRRNPDVTVELFCTGRTVDLIEERFDLGIRAGALADSTLIAKSLGRVSWFVVAAPIYFKKRKRPKSPDDLQEHEWLLFGSGQATVPLRFERNGPPVDVNASPRLMVNDMDVALSAALAGQGLTLLPAFLCADAIRAGKLERLLHEWVVPSVPIHVVYPSTRHLSPKVKSFIDHLQQRMTPPPWEVGPVP